MENITTNINNKKLNNEGGTIDSEVTSWKVRKVADELSVSVKTVKRLIADGVLPVVQIRGCIRVPKWAVMDWIQGQTRYNSTCVELLPSLTGESTCNSLSEKASTTCPTSRQVDARLDALLKPATKS